MSESIDRDRLYTADETRQLLGGIGMSKLKEYIRRGIISPFRRRPSLFLGLEILGSMQRIVECNRKKSCRFEDFEEKPNPADYGIE